MRGRRATQDEWRRLWPKVLVQFKGFDDYRELSDRDIPLVILEPRDGSSS